MIATLRECTFAELEALPGAVELVAEYAGESRMPGMPEPKAHFDTYRTLDHAGVLHAMAALVDGHLVGFAILLVSILPHYSVPMAHTESLFVSAAYRKAGIGLRLLSAIEWKAKTLGAVGLFVSAALHSPLMRVMSRSKSYLETNHVFLKVLA